jgi:hypothetical protein
MNGFAGIEALTAALADLGELLREQSTPTAIYVIGGGAFLLLEPHRAQATSDLDVAALVTADGTIRSAAPLPASLAEAAAIVARIHDLPAGWINAAAAASFDDLVRDGALERATAHTWGALTVHVAAREDLLVLKLRAAHRRGAKGERYRRDVAAMRPSDAELDAARRAIAGEAYPREHTERMLAEIRRWRDG